MFFCECVEQAKFLFVLKHENIMPVYKKGYRGSKDNYFPVSVLPNISKIFEKVVSEMGNQR